MMEWSLMVISIFNGTCCGFDRRLALVRCCRAPKEYYSYSLSVTLGARPGN